MHLRLALATLLTLATGLVGCAQEKAPPAPSTSHAALADEPDQPAAAPAAQQAVVVRTPNGQTIIFQPGCVSAAAPQGASLVSDDDLDNMAQPTGDDKFLNDDDFPSGDEGPTGPSPVASPSFDSDYSPDSSSGDSSSSSDSSSDAQQAAAHAATAPVQQTCAPVPVQG